METFHLVQTAHLDHETKWLKSDRFVRNLNIHILTTAEKRTVSNEN